MKYYVGIRRDRDNRSTVCNVLFTGLIHRRVSVFHLVIIRMRTGINKMRPVSRETINKEICHYSKISEHDSFAEAEMYIQRLENYCSEKPYDIIEDEKEIIEVTD